MADKARAMEQWVANQDVSNCKSCSAKFSWTSRRNHCRVCGNIFCGKCSKQKMTVPEEYGWGSAPQKVCKGCVEVLNRKPIISNNVASSAPPTKSKPRTDKGVDDMIMLSKVSEESIVENLKKRFEADLIYTYIGHVLISVNPFKSIKDLYSQRTLRDYRGKYAYELPPHVYMVAEELYRDMMRELKSQCVIISGESGAGKTEASKKILEYIVAVSGGAADATRVKDVILDSNPLLEAFGNAKTIRNNNSSRFGKYMEITFSGSGVPRGGFINNYLLEKSRVVQRAPDERNFHIFYEITSGITDEQKREFGIKETDPKFFQYLNQSNCYKVDTIDDLKDFNDVVEAMNTMGIQEDEQKSIVRLCFAILYLGNIKFQQDDKDCASVSNRDMMDSFAKLFGVNGKIAEQTLIQRVISTGTEGRSARTSTYSVPLDVAGAEYSRDAFAKAMYSRLFDWIVSKVNQSMAVTDTIKGPVIGVLDIYGFEIFGRNGFEQLCINYVNEKLQQIFIELTLKAEQEEYTTEKIAWEPVDYFNNKICCDLIEGKKPPGMLALLDDTCNFPKGNDEAFLDKISKSFNNHKHLTVNVLNKHFTIFHYAGEVTYDTNGFVDKNKDLFFNNFIELGQTSSYPLIVALFPDSVSSDSKKRPTTAGFKIKESIGSLVTTLMECTPHYIRTIKSNDRKQAGLFDLKLVAHQVKYLGLYENVRVRRAGYAYRQHYDKFFFRYRILSDKTWPKWSGDYKAGAETVLKEMSMMDDPKEIAFGVTKIFIRHPELVFTLEEHRERKVWTYAIKIQNFFKKYVGRFRYFYEIQKEGYELAKGKKERRRESLERTFSSDYVYFASNMDLKLIVERYGSEKMLFGSPGFIHNLKDQKVPRILLLTDIAIYLIGLTERKDKKQNQSNYHYLVTRRIDLSQLKEALVSPYADSFFGLRVTNQHDALIECRRKIEFFATLQRVKRIPINFVTSETLLLKKDKAKTVKQAIKWQTDSSATNPTLNKKTWTISVPSGLPSTSVPNFRAPPERRAPPALGTGNKTFNQGAAATRGGRGGAGAQSTVGRGGVGGNASSGGAAGTARGGGAAASRGASTASRGRGGGRGF